jgi:hypothetical protein
VTQGIGACDLGSTHREYREARRPGSSLLKLRSFVFYVDGTCVLGFESSVI